MSQCRKFAAIWIFTVAVLSIAGLATFYKKFLQPENPPTGGTSEKLSAGAGDWSRSNALNGSSTVNRLEDSSLRPTNILTSSTQTVQTLSNQSSGGVSYVQNVTGGEESTTRVNHYEKMNRTATASTSDLVLNAHPVIFNFFNFFVSLKNNYTRDFPVPHSLANDNDPQVSSSSERSRPNFRVETLPTSTALEDKTGPELSKSGLGIGENVGPLLTPDSGSANQTRMPQSFIEDQRSESDLHFSTGNVMLANNTFEMKTHELPTTDGYSRAVEIEEGYEQADSRLTARNTIDGSRIDSGHRSSGIHTLSISTSKDTSDHRSFGSFPITGSSSSLESYPKVERYNNILHPIDEFRSSSPSVYTPLSIGTSHSVSSELGLSTATSEETAASESKVNDSPTYSSTEVMGQTGTRSSPHTSRAGNRPTSPVTSVQETTRYLRMEASLSSLQNNYSVPVKVSVTTPYSRFSTNNLPSSDMIKNSSSKDYISDHKAIDGPTKLSHPFLSTSKLVVTESSRTVSHFADAIEIKSTGQTENNAATLRSSSVSNPIAIPNSSSNHGTQVLVEDPTPTTYPGTNAPTPSQSTTIGHSTSKSGGGYSHAYSSSTSYLTNFVSAATVTAANTRPKRPFPPVTTTASTTTEEPNAYENENANEHGTDDVTEGEENYNDGTRSG